MNRSNRSVRAAGIGGCLFVALPALAQSLVGLSIPVGSMDATCKPKDSGVWSVAGSPPPYDQGIGWLVNPNPPGFNEYVLHDHGYTSPNIPDPSRAIVTYEYDQPVQVRCIDVIQHTNGISKIEVLIGDDLQSMTSAGEAFGPKGDVVGNLKFAEFEPYRFEFTPGPSGRYVQVIVRKTSLHNGWASYRMFPRTVPCYADCEGDCDLDVFDFLCFQGVFSAQGAYADCEQDGDWDIFDYLCFLNEYGQGCGS